MFVYGIICTTTARKRENHLHNNQWPAYLTSLLAMGLTINHLLKPKLMEFALHFFTFTFFNNHFSFVLSLVFGFVVVPVIFFTSQLSTCNFQFFQIYNWACQSSAAHITLIWAFLKLNLRLSNLPNRTIRLLKYYSGRGCRKCSEREWRKSLVGSSTQSLNRYKAFVRKT